MSCGACFEAPFTVGIVHAIVYAGIDEQQIGRLVRPTSRTPYQQRS